MRGETATIETLAEDGADVNAKDSDGGTILMFAAGPWADGDHAAAVAALLKAGADPEATGTGGPMADKTALELATEAGHEAVAALLRKAAGGGGASS